MSWFSKAVKKVGKWAGDRIGNGPSIGGLKSSIKGTGKFVTSDVGKGLLGGALTLTGVGAPLGAALLAGSQVGGNLAAGKNIGQSLKAGVVDGATSFVGGQALGKLGSMAGKIPKVGGLVTSATNALQGGPVGDLSGAVKVGDMVNHLDVSKLGGGGNMGLGSSLWDAGKSLVKNTVKDTLLGSDGKFGWEDVGRGIKSVGGWAKDHPDLLLGGLSAYEGINAQNDANKYRDRALAMVEQDAANRGQFRDMGMQRLNSVQRADLGSLFAGSGNPYALGGGVPRVGGMAPQGPAMPAGPAPAPQVMGQAATPEQAAFRGGGGGLIPRIGQMRRQLEEAA